MKKINIIQDEATPHNNLLLQELVHKKGESNVDIYYSIEQSRQYSWGKDITNEVKKAKIFGQSINFSLIFYFLKNRKKETFFMVGWSNPTTKLIFLVSILFGFNLNMWFDLPDENASRGKFKNKLRAFFYFLLKKSNIKVFCVGKITVNYFISRGFDKKKLENLPIQVLAVDKPKTSVELPLKLFSGSRLIKDKGYDILLRAIAQIEQEVIGLELVGTGPEREFLESLVDELGISNQVKFLNWLAPDEYLHRMSKADVFVHPAKVDAYGGSAIALAQGVPVIGSETAGAVIECVRHGENGFSYNPNDVHALAALINRFIDDPSLVIKMSKTAILHTKKYDIDYWTENLIKGLR